MPREQQLEERRKLINPNITSAVDRKEPLLCNNPVVCLCIVSVCVGERERKAVFVPCQRNRAKRHSPIPREGFTTQRETKIIEPTSKHEPTSSTNVVTDILLSNPAAEKGRRSALLSVALAFVSLFSIRA
eukprot:TRINITY_DN451_c0_g1_i1.p1 TRINITY_DN451_c0_g1~~TRINITY_DN451_c0_g1_i1.p1  ORF type:complete len:130 (+),score=10.38 TRINITY_DN451_c0_g1_i1:919-1308(+)